MALKLICLTLAISLAPVALEQKFQTPNLPPVHKCDGPNEHLVALGGGCFVQPDGTQKCLPAPPPSCKCLLGFERNPANNRCEAAPGGRAKRDTKPKCGQNETLKPVIGGCYINPEGKHICPQQAPPPVCVCEIGFVLNPATNKCEAAPGGAAIRATRDTEPKCGPNESILPVLGGCFINAEGKHDCSQRAPPKCVCNSGFERNAATKKCEAVAAPGAGIRATRDTADQTLQCNGPHEMLLITKGCPIDANGNRDCSKKAPNTCGCEPGFERNATTKKCEKSVTAVRAGRAARSPKCKKCQSV